MGTSAWMFIARRKDRLAGNSLNIRDFTAKFNGVVAGFAKRGA